MNLKLLILLTCASMAIYAEPATSSKGALALPAPVNFTHPNFACSFFDYEARGRKNAFFQEIIAHPAYVNEFLVDNFIHIIQILESAKKQKLSSVYYQSIFNLFTNCLKRADYIQPAAIADLLEKLPDLLSHLSTPISSQPCSSFKDIINEMFISSLKNEFPLFQHQPTLFIDKVSKQAHENIEWHTALLSFLEVVLNKLIWSPKEQIKTWQSAKHLSEMLTKLCENEIILNGTHLNNLFITLIERYNLFLELTYDQLNPEFYKSLKDELLNNPPLMVSLAEEEAFLETKTHRLQRTLLTCEAKTLAREAGIRC